MNTLRTPTTSIPQPPHSAGLAYKGLRANIDYNSIPSPIDAFDNDREQWSDQPYMTLPGNHVPLSTTEFVGIDRGNSSPRFIRMSTWNVPSTSRLASDCEIPLVAMIQPFADQDSREEPVPVVDTGEIGPARCAGCRGYINSWCKWVSSGARWQCNLCGHETEVVPEYYCNLDANLLRLDHLQRPELNKGTVDFVVPEEYWATHPPPRIEPLYQAIVSEPTAGLRKPEAMNYVFAFDVSLDAVRSGFTRAACTILLDHLFGREDGSVEPCILPESQICIITFDETLHFYDLSPRPDGSAAMLVVPECDDVFVPLVAGLFGNPRESNYVISRLLTSIASREEASGPDAALGSALTASLAVLAGRGGQVIAFTGVIPSIGIGALNPPVDESSVFGTEKEKQLFLPRHGSWRDIAEQCAEEGIGVNLFLGMNRPIDVASIGAVSSITGGELYFHPRFDPGRDTLVLASQLRRLLTRMTGFNCVMRIRCSNGLRISKSYGNFHEPELSVTDLQFGTLDADKAFSVQFEHAHPLNDRDYAFIQCAVLYNTRTGERRVRVCNLALQVATLAGNVFRYADMDTVVCHMVREGISKLPTQQISQIQEQLTEKCCAILLGYRKHCAASAAPTQLIIPEAFRTLPVYTLAVMKSKPLKSRNITADVRNYEAHKIMAMGVGVTMQHLYPRLLAIHDLDNFVALPDPATGKIDFPSLMRNSHLFMESHGIYLIDNEELMIFWIGANASPQLLKDLLDVDDIMHVDPYMVELPRLSTRLSTQVHNILSHRSARRGWIPKIMIARQNMDAAELEFSDMLIEDQNNAAMSYLDYLCLVHKQITTALQKGSSIGSRSGFMSTPW